MSYQLLDACHISDLVQHLRNIGYKTEEYPSKKTCIKELRSMGVFQIPTKVTTTKIKNHKRSINPITISNREVSSLTPNQINDNESGFYTVHDNPLLQQNIPSQSKSVNPIVIPITNALLNTTKNGSYTHSDGAYKNIAVTQKLVVDETLVVGGLNVTESITNINNSYSNIKQNVKNIDNRIRELDDKTSEIVNMNLPMYNIAKTITIENLKDLISVEKNESDINTTITNLKYNGKLLDTTVHLNISFYINFEKKINNNKTMDVRRIEISLPEYITPDDTHFKYYPVIKNIVNKKIGDNEPTLNIFKLYDKYAYIDAIQKKLICRFAINPQQTQISMLCSFSMCYFMKPHNMQSMYIIRPVRYTSMYMNQIEETIDNKISTTTSMWTVFDEQVDLIINYTSEYTVVNSINNLHPNFKIKLPFQSSNTPEIDKIGSSIVFYNKNDDDKALVTSKALTIIRMNDPAHIQIQLYLLNSGLSNNGIYNLDITIYISYYRDLTDMINPFIFTGTVKHNNNVYCFPNTNINVSFITLEPINTYYLQNKFKLVSTTNDTFNPVVINTIIKGVQTNWEAEIIANYDLEAGSIGNISCNLRLFDIDYNTTNKLCIINSNIEMDVSFKNDISNITLTITDVIGVLDLPHDLHITLSNTNYEIYQSNIINNIHTVNTRIEYTFENLINNTTYDINIYTTDLLERTTLIYDNTQRTLRSEVPQIMDFKVIEEMGNISWKGSVFFFDSSNIIKPISIYQSLNNIKQIEDVLAAELIFINSGDNEFTNKFSPNISKIYGTNEYTVQILTVSDSISEIGEYSSTNEDNYTIILQQINKCNIINGVYNVIDEVFYSNNLSNIVFNLEPSRDDFLEGLTAYLITSEHTIASNIKNNNVSFQSEQNLSNAKLHIQMFNFEFENNDVLVIDNNPLSTSNTVITFKTYRYHEYELVIDFITNSYMIYTANIEFDDPLISDKNISNSYLHSSNIIQVYLPTINDSTQITGNVVLTDRLDNVFKSPFNFLTFEYPTIVCTGNQTNHSFNIYSTILQTPAFENWDGYFDWYINDILQNTPGNLASTFVLSIPSFENANLRIDVKANVNNWSNQTLIGNVNIPVYGVKDANISFDKQYYTNDENIYVSFEMLSPSPTTIHIRSDVSPEYGNVDWTFKLNHQIYKHTSNVREIEVDMTNIVTNEDIVHIIITDQDHMEIANILLFETPLLVNWGNLSYITETSTPANISIQLFSENNEFSELVSLEVYKYTSVNVKFLPNTNRIAGSFYAKVTANILDNNIEFLSQTNPLIDIDKVSSISTYVQSNPNWSLYISNIIDDTQIPHMISTYIYSNTLEYNFLNRIHNVSNNSEFPMKLTDLSNYDSINDVIKIVVNDPLHGNTIFYHPENFRYKLKHGSHISYKYDNMTNIYSANVTCSLLHNEQLVTDYTSSNISFCFEDTENHSNICSEELIQELKHLYIQTTIQPSITYDVYINIEDLKLYVGYVYAPVYTFDDLYVLNTLKLVIPSDNLPDGHIVIFPSVRMKSNHFNQHSINSILYSIECEEPFTITQNNHTETLINYNFNNMTYVICSNVSDVFQQPLVKSIYPFYITINRTPNIYLELNIKLYDLTLTNVSSSIVHIVNIYELHTHMDLELHFLNTDSSIIKNFVVLNNYDTPTITSSNL
jgi:hypothetical protein